LQGALSGNAAGTILVSNTILRIPDAQATHLNFTGTGFTWSVGNIVGPGKLVNDAGNTLNLIYGVYKFLSTTLENLGTIKVSDTFYPGSASALLKNAGTLEFVNDLGVSTSGGFVLGIVNTGTLLKSGGIGTSTIDADVTNTGTITEQSGHFSFPRGVH
jgi:hypothetical protein